ncbi:ECF-type sigma factor [soil metagenome]
MDRPDDDPTQAVPAEPPDDPDPTDVVAGPGASSIDGSISRWIADYKAGESAAAQPLWERYFERLVRRARRRLSNAPGAESDEEDVALSAFRACFKGMRAGRFPKLDDRDDLWRILVKIAADKAVDQIRRATREKRGGGQVRPEADYANRDDDGPLLDRVIGREPSPEFAAMVAEEYRQRLDALASDRQRSIAALKLECYSNDEIKDLLGCSLRTVTLSLEAIRKTWQADPIS